MTTPNSLRLLAKDAEDLKVVSACLQDALVPVSDIAWFQEDRQLALAVNRFMWEQTAEKVGGSQLYHRTHALIRVNNVTAVRSRGYDRGKRAGILSMLSVQPIEDGVEFLFAQGAVIRLGVDDLNVTLIDMASPWPTRWRPDHDEATE